MAETPRGEHTHGRHGYRLESPSALRAHLSAVHDVTPAIEATDENWDLLATVHLAAHQVAEVSDSEPGSPLPAAGRSP